jgi:UDP-N-acetylmuramoyl-L-alanyl-D-glutamate--2,6-diaminopimelate ligase
MLLSSLLGADATAPPGSGSIDVAGLTADSRQVRRGYLFVAVTGSKADGARFIADAVAKGAAAVLVSAATEVANAGSVPVLRANEPRRALALMAARFYGAQPETTVAVTGTSG